jgi:DNA-binding transcriptional ArsR family regulator
MVVDLIDRPDADRLFHALADATRRDIVTRTMREPLSVTALAGAYPMSFAAVQKHVAVLHAADLVTKERQGREQLVRGNVAALRRASALLDQLEALWTDRMDRLGDALAADLDEGMDR